ncbi:hypothetical protein B0H16DRAFT_1500754 [Mycena metata]|uniref:Uncharacterized protein n=1 Tax=Mycena metata TaxID=1033252 RepID=A0AAD7K5S1_9AGAR|nr:hypothetical protein B0H16DRAFT_1500754 [Mycena metata]
MAYIDRRALTSTTAFNSSACSPHQLHASIVVQTMTRANTLQTLCKTTPEKALYLCLTDRLVEICTLVTSGSRMATAALVFFAVKKTESLVENGVDAQLPPKVLEGLEKFESILVAIRTHIESIPEQSTKARKLRLSALAFRLKTEHLQGKLSRVHKSLMKISAKPQSYASRNERILETVSFTTRVAAAIVEIPVLNLVKPVVEMTALICDTAKVVKSNREAAIDLAEHAQNVTNSVVARATAGDENSLEVLCGALDKIQKFLDTWKDRRGGVASLVLAAKDKDQFAGLHLALDRALEVFTSSQTIKTADLVRTSTADLAVVRATVTSVEDDVKHVIVKIFVDGNSQDSVGISIDSPDLRNNLI